MMLPVVVLQNIHVLSTVAVLYLSHVFNDQAAMPGIDPIIFFSSLKVLTEIAP